MGSRVRGKGLAGTKSHAGRQSGGGARTGKVRGAPASCGRGNLSILPPCPLRPLYPLFCDGYCRDIQSLAWYRSRKGQHDDLGCGSGGQCCAAGVTLALAAALAGVVPLMAIGRRRTWS